jgi:hypothetical protein
MSEHYGLCDVWKFGFSSLQSIVCTFYTINIIIIVWDEVVDGFGLTFSSDVLPSYKIKFLTDVL